MNRCYFKLACIVSNIDSIKTTIYSQKDAVTGAITAQKYAQLCDIVHEGEIKHLSDPMPFNQFISELRFDDMVEMIEAEAKRTQRALNTLDHVPQFGPNPFKIAPTAFPSYEDLDKLAAGAWTDKQIVKYFADLKKFAKAWAKKRAAKK